MKTASKFLVLLTALLFSIAPALRAQDGPPPDADDQGASFQTFYDNLGDQGQWVQTDNYGYVFQPNVSDPNWAPYSDGHWVYTDDGWMWVSDEPWGWATYHYGRWANINGTGWVWVPGYRWAPAWVSWRYGGGYCGWAPLPPETFVGVEYANPGVAIGVGFHFGGDVDVNFGIGPACYNFVRVNDFGYPNYRGRYLDRGRNFTVINNTTNITNINVNRINNGTINNFNNGNGNNFRGVAVNGPQLNDINAASAQKIQRVKLAESNQPGRAQLQGDSLSVYAPRVNPYSANQAKPARVGQTISNPTFNRGVAADKPLDITSSVKGVTPNAEELAAARAAEAKSPQKARIATLNTAPKTTFQQPLSQMKPVGQYQKKPATGIPQGNPAVTGNPAANGASPYGVNNQQKNTAQNPAYNGGPVHQPAQATQTPNEAALTGENKKAKKPVTTAESPYTGGNAQTGQSPYQKKQSTGTSQAELQQQQQEARQQRLEKIQQQQAQAKATQQDRIQQQQQLHQQQMQQFQNPQHSQQQQQQAVHSQQQQQQVRPQQQQQQVVHPQQQQQQVRPQQQQQVQQKPAPQQKEKVAPQQQPAGKQEGAQGQGGAPAGGNPYGR